MFASKTKKHITVAGDDGAAVTVTIRKLSWTVLDKASAEQMRKAVQSAQQAGAELVKVWRETPTGAPKPESEQDQRDARYRRYERATVLAHGVEAWTASADVKGTLQDLDEDVADLLFKEIVDLSLGPLTKEAALEARGEAEGAASAA